MPESIALLLFGGDADQGSCACNHFMVNAARRSLLVRLVLPYLFHMPDRIMHTVPPLQQQQQQQQQVFLLDDRRPRRRQ